MSNFHFIKQHDIADCGPSCLAMVARFYGKDYTLEGLRDRCYLNREGVSIVNISEAAEEIGFRALMAKLDPGMLIEECPLPCILHWNQEHFVVLRGVRKKRFAKTHSKENTIFSVADPAHGLVDLEYTDFNRAWVSTSENQGIALALEPTTRFYEKDVGTPKTTGVSFLLKYLLPFKKHFIQIIFGMAVATAITVVFPFLTQILIDIGVIQKNYPVIYLIFMSQVLLFLGSITMDMIRSWLLFHINARISLNIVSDFLVKLLRLPLKYFDSKSVGDISQRINDHHRIETFLTGSVINTMFSIVSIIVFIIVSLLYDWRICCVFLFFSAAGLIWVTRFQKKRRDLDYKIFARNRENQDKLYEMIWGMQEVKLYGGETAKRWDWERLQVKAFRLNIKSLSLEQYQHFGIVLLNYIKNFLVTFVIVGEVVQGRMTVGALLSISYIIGQTNGPIEQLADFTKAAQDAKLSLSRLREIHLKENEDKETTLHTTRHELENKDLVLSNVSYQYDGPGSPFVLQNISMVIPHGKVTAIVGTSGSGKTTLMKLLLKFYDPVSGSIHVGNKDLASITSREWRQACASVMQDGYIFNDTIARNIVLDGSDIDAQRMENAVYVSNCTEFINDLPLRFTTKIGSSGIGLSGGQRQRLLIARAVYKNAGYLLFDEATSSLDANNERTIMSNLKEYFKGRTVIVIAHRLSTVRNADQIIVLEKGQIVTAGSHDTLVKEKGAYFELVKNQLELAK